jgi:hypothetical protein
MKPASSVFISKVQGPLDVVLRDTSSRHSQDQYDLWDATNNNIQTQQQTQTSQGATIAAQAATIADLQASVAALNAKVGITS